MRPLDKGTCPQRNGADKVVTNYTDWRSDLIERIGYYCAYCNIPLSHSLNVEHVIPKKPPAGYVAGSPLGWDNMLLACSPCNSAKGSMPINFDEYYFPEENNTYLPFEIVVHSTNSNAAIVNPRNTLNANQLIRANNMINLVGLQNIDNRPAVVDIRWKRRRDAMLAVEICSSLFNMAQGSVNYNPDQAAEAIATIAKQTGFFGLWFDKFSNEPLVLQYLIDPNIIPGTAQSCFAPITNLPINRNLKNISDPI